MVSTEKKVTSNSAPTLSLRQYHPSAPTSGSRARPKTRGMILHPMASLPKREMPRAMMNLPRGGWRSNWYSPCRYLLAITGKYFSSHRILDGKPRWYILAHIPSTTAKTVTRSIERYAHDLSWLRSDLIGRKCPGLARVCKGACQYFGFPPRMFGNAILCTFPVFLGEWKRSLCTSVSSEAGGGR